MQNNRYQMIKQQLLQYVVSLIENSPLENHTKVTASRHEAVALLLEQALEIAYDANEKHYDMHIAKPIFKAQIILIKDRLQSIEGAIRTMTHENYCIDQLLYLKTCYEEQLKLLEKNFLEMGDDVWQK